MWHELTGNRNYTASKSDIRWVSWKMVILNRCIPVGIESGWKLSSPCPTRPPLQASITKQIMGSSPLSCKDLSGLPLYLASSMVNILAVYVTFELEHLCRCVYILFLFCLFLVRLWCSFFPTTSFLLMFCIVYKTVYIWCEFRFNKTTVHKPSRLLCCQKKEWNVDIVLQQICMKPVKHKQSLWKGGEHGRRNYKDTNP